MNDSENLPDVILVIEELCEDSTIPKNIKAKFQKILSMLKDSKKNSIKVNQALSELDEVNEDINLQPYIRTQIWNISSMLEKIPR